MAELIGPKFEKSKPDYTGMGIIDTAVAKAVGTRKDRGTENMDFSNMRAGPMAARSSRGDSFETKALKNTLAAVSLFDEKDQEAYFSVLNDMLQFNIINQDESLAKIKASEFAAKNIGYDGAIPVNLDEKTLFKIMLDTQDKLPADLKLKLEGNTDIVGNKELENINLTAGKLGINFDGETAVGNYNYKNGKLSVKPTITKTDDNLQTGTTAQYLFNEEMVMIMGSDNKPRHIPKDSITVNFQTDKVLDDKLGTVSYVKRTDEGDEKATVFLESYLANENETGGAEKQFQLSGKYITDKGVELSGEKYKDVERDQNQNVVGIKFPISDFANIEAKKYQGDFVDENNLRLNVDKTFDLDHGGTLGMGGFYDQDGNWNAGINYSLAFGEANKPEKKAYNYSTNEPLEALEFLKRNQTKLYNKGGRVRMASGGIVGILKLS